MIELSQRRTAAPRARSQAKQQSRLLIALILLLVALAVVLIKDRQFWFGSESTIVDANDIQPAAASQTATKPAAPPVAPVPARAAKKQVAAANIPAEHEPGEAPAMVTNRTVLPPLDVEVVAGNAHRNLHPKSNATKVEIADQATPAVRQPAPTVNAAQSERIAEATVPSYPALAQHMNVQGSVVLQALIAADGTIQSLRVTSGPAILASAAKQAVSEWHFKPVLQNGQAVETRATITVNFTIKVADSAANTTLADSQVSDQLIITR